MKKIITDFRFFENKKAKNEFTDYYLVVNLDERGEYSATVYNPDDKSVFEIDSAEYMSELIEDGFLKYKADEDLLGLTRYLISVGIIPKYSELHDEDYFDKRIREKYS